MLLRQKFILLKQINIVRLLDYDDEDIIAKTEAFDICPNLGIKHTSYSVQVACYDCILEHN